MRFELRNFFLLLSLCKAQQPTTSNPQNVTISEPCDEGLAYNRLDICQCYCFHTPGINKTCEAKILFLEAYKGVYLNDSQYYITPDGILHLTGHLQNVSQTKFTPSNYFNTTALPNYTVVVCYPLHSSFFRCQKRLVEDDFEIYPDETLYMSLYKKNYTIDRFRKYDSSVVICQNEDHFTATYMQTVGYACSAGALLITLIVSLKTMKRNSNMPLFVYIGMMFFGTIFAALQPYSVHYRSYMCPTVPLLTQFFGLSAFIWMNIQVYSLHATFSKLQISNETRSRKVYIIYCVIGIGIPLLICGVTLLVDQLEIPVLRPSLHKCNFGFDGSSYLYFHGPICISLALNLVMFISILLRACKLANDASSVNKQAWKQMCIMAVKLIFIMGFCYITRLIVWGMRLWGSVWNYIDVISTFQGVYILCAYILNARTLKIFFKDCKICKVSPIGLKSRTGSVDTATSELSVKTTPL